MVTCLAWKRSLTDQVCVQVAGCPAVLAGADPVCDNATGYLPSLPLEGMAALLGAQALLLGLIWVARQILPIK